jgi:hypothetical protein
MSKALTSASDVQCGHQGAVQAKSSAKLTVSGNAVLLATGVVGSPVTNCSTKLTSIPTSPCTTVVSLLPTSLAQKLTVGGLPVVLDTLSGLTDGVPPGSLESVAGQSKLTAA